MSETTARTHAHSSGETFYPPTIRARRWWVNWVLGLPYDDEGEIVPDATPTKQPIAPYDNGTARTVPWNSALPDDEHPATDFGTVEPWEGLRIGVDLARPENVESDRVGVGIIIPVNQHRNAERPITLIDWDDVRDPDTDELHPVCARAIEEVGGYVEISQSGKGIHQFVYGTIPGGFAKFIREIGDEPFVGDDLPQVEMYCSGRLTAMTGRHVEGAGDDVVEGQDLIDRLCWEFGTASNSSTDTPTDPYARKRGEGAAAQEPTPTTTPSHDDVGDALRSSVAYDGPDPDEWDIPPGRSLDYHAVLKARERSDELATTANWELIGYAAAFGWEAGQSQSGVLADLKQHPTPRHGYRPRKAEKEVRSVFRKAEAGNNPLPSRTTLAKRGILPEEWVEENNDTTHVVELPKIYRPETSWGGLDAQTAGERFEPGRENPDAPSIDDLQQETQATIGRAMHGGRSVVVDAIMGAGKTYGSFAAAHDLDEPIMYTAPRKDLYGQAQDYAQAVGFDESDILTLPTPDDCPTFTGLHGKEWKRRVWGLYELGASASTIHNLLADELPCCADADEHPEEPLCEYRRKNQYDPTEYDVIVGHYKHAHLDHVTFGRAVLFDEAPGSTFLTELRGEALVRAVNAFLSLHHSPPIEGWDDLLQARHDPERRREALDWFETAENGEPFDLEKPDERNVIHQEGEGYHGHGPHAVYTILASEPIDDPHGLYDDPESESYEFELAELPGYRHKALFFASNGEFGHSDGAGYYVQIQTPPDLEKAKSVIALDGTPMLDTWTTGEDDPRPAEWEQALGRHLGYERILSDDERAAFLRDTMGHTYVQTTENVRPYSSGNYNHKEKDAALLAGLSDEYLHGEPVDVTITSKRVKEEYLDDGFVERGLTDDIAHSGEVRGSDAYAECDSGAILGSAHHGDHEVARRAAWLGARVKPEHVDGDRTYGPTGNAILHQMREQDTAQVALRIGRGKDGKGALVAIHTSAYPEWLPVVNRESPGEVRTWSAAERAAGTTTRKQNMADAADATDGGQLVFRTQELIDGAQKLLAEGGKSLSESRLRQALNEHAKRGLLRKEPDPEDGRRSVWVDTGLSSYTSDQSAVVSLPDIDRDTAEEKSGNSPKETTIREIARLSDPAGPFDGPLVADRETVVNEVLGGVELDPPTT